MKWSLTDILSHHSSLVTVISIGSVSLMFLYHVSLHHQSFTQPLLKSTTPREQLHHVSKHSKTKSSKAVENPENAIVKSNSEPVSKPSLRSETLKKFLDVWIAGGSFPGLMVSIIKNSNNNSNNNNNNNNSNNNDSNTNNHEEQEEIFYHSVGYADVERSKQISRETIFRIYSMTKPITALAALILIDRGLLFLDDLVSKFIPSFAHQKVLVGGTIDQPILEDIYSPMTIRHLLTHTSGLTYGIFGNSLHDALLRNSFTPEDCRNWFLNLTSQEFCDKIASAPLTFQPGKAFLYGLSSDVLGHVIEIVSKQTLREFFLTEIFIPLEMQDTDFYVPESKLHRLANVYEVVPGNQYCISTNPERRRDILPTLCSGGGGLVSTVDDYTKFVKFMLRKCKLENGRTILSSKLYEVMTSNQLPDGKDLVELSIDNAFSESIGEGVGYGYGISVLINPHKCKGGHLSSSGEYGWGGVASSWFVVDPIRNSAVILMANLIPSSAYPIRSQLRTLYHWVADGKDEDSIIRP